MIEENVTAKEINPSVEVSDDDIELFSGFRGRIVLAKCTDGSDFTARLVRVKGSFVCFVGRDGRASILRISDIARIFELNGRS